MHVRALGRVSLRSPGGTLQYLDFKTHRNLLGGIAHRVVASLILQSAVYGVPGGHDRLERPYHHRDAEVSAIHVKLLVRRERKRSVLASWVGGSQYRDVRWGIQLQFGLLQVFLPRVVRVDVIARGNAEQQMDRAWLAAMNRLDFGWVINDGRLASRRNVLGSGRGRQRNHEGKSYGFHFWAT